MKSNLWRLRKKGGGGSNNKADPSFQLNTGLCVHYYHAPEIGLLFLKVHNSSSRLPSLSLLLLCGLQLALFWDNNGTRTHYTHAHQYRCITKYSKNYSHLFNQKLAHWFLLFQGIITRTLRVLGSSPKWNTNLKRHLESSIGLVCK